MQTMCHNCGKLANSPADWGGEPFPCPQCGAEVSLGSSRPRPAETLAPSETAEGPRIAPTAAATAPPTTRRTSPQLLIATYQSHMMAMGIVLYVAGVYNTVGGVINLAALFEPGDIPTNPISGGWSLAVGIAFVVLGALARRHHVWVNYWVCALSGLSLLVVLLTIAILAFCHGRMIGFGLACAFVLYGILAVLSIRNLSKVEKIESAGLDPRKAP